MLKANLDGIAAKEFFGGCLKTGLFRKLHYLLLEGGDGDNGEVAKPSELSAPQ